MVFQQRPKPPQRKSAVQVVLLLLLAAMLLWVLSSMNMIQGAWTTVFNAIFSSLGTIFALLQWYMQAIPEQSVLSLHETARSHKQCRSDQVKRHEGAIVVYASRKWRGSTLHLIQGLQETSETITAVANVVECRIAGKHRYFCHFPLVSPGHYTLVASSIQKQVQITVYPEHTSEIDWR